MVAAKQTRGLFHALIVNPDLPGSTASIMKRPADNPARKSLQVLKQKARIATIQRSRASNEYDGY